MTNKIISNISGCCSWAYKYVATRAPAKYVATSAPAIALGKAKDIWNSLPETFSTNLEKARKAWNETTPRAVAEAGGELFEAYVGKPVKEKAKKLWQDVPPKEEIIELITDAAKNPVKKGVPLANRVWCQIPHLGRIGILTLGPSTIYYLSQIPYWLLSSAPLIWAGKIVYSELAPKKLTDSIDGQLKELHQKAIAQIPALQTAEEALPVLAEAVKDAANGQITFAGHNVNLTIDKAPDPTRALAAITDLAAQTNDHISSNGAKPLPKVQEDSDLPLQPVEALAAPPLEQLHPPVNDVPLQPAPQPALPIEAAVVPPPVLNLEAARDTGVIQADIPAPAAIIPPPQPEPAVVEVPQVAAPQQVLDVGRPEEPDGPQAEAKPENWEKKSNVIYDSVIDHASNGSLLFYMYYKIGKIPSSSAHPSEAAAPSIYDLVRKSTTPDARGNKPNLASLFIKHYKIPFGMQWLRCHLVNFLWFKTSIVPNVIRVNILRRIGKYRTLDPNSGKKQSVLVKDFLSQANLFFERMCTAAEEFATAPPGKSNGDLDSYFSRTVNKRFGYSPKRVKADSNLKKEIEKRAGAGASDETLDKIRDDLALENLCKRFAERELATNYTYVPFFESWKKVKFIGSFLGVISKPIEWILNKVIYSTLKTQVLPSVFKTIIETGLDEADTHNLPFTLPVTRFFTRFFRSIKLKLERQGDEKPIDEDKKKAGTDLLPTVVANFKKLLDILPSKGESKDKLSIAKKIEAVKAAGAMKEIIKKAIENGIVNGAHIFLDFALHPENREPLLHDLGMILEEIYSKGSPKDKAGWDKLEQEYIAEKEDLTREARAVFSLIVEDAAKKLPPRSEKTEEVADGSFEKQKQNAEQTFQFIKEKIPAVKQNIDSENPDEIAELQPLISELSEKLKTFANQAKAQRELEGLAPADKEAIDKALALIYEKSANLMNRIANLLVSQVKYTSSLKIERALEAIQLQMNAISKQNPLHLCDLIPKMKSSLSEIKKHFKKDPEIATELSTMIEELSSSKKDAPAAFERIEREEQILMSLKDLYPCFVDPAKKTDLRSDDSAQEESDPGLLVQLATYEQCKHNRTERNRLFPEGFDLKDTKIKEALALLPAEDQPALKQFIKRIKDYGKNPVGIDFQREIWVPLTEKLQQIYAAANERNNAANRDVDKTLHHFNPRIVQKIAQYQNLRKDKQRELSQTAAQAEELIAQLQKAAADAQRAPAVKINPEHLPYIAGTLAGLTGLVLGPVPALALGAAANLAVNNLGALANDNGRMGAAVNVAGGAALAGVAANLLPGLAGIAGGAKLAYNAAQNMEEEAIKTTVKEVVDEVMKIFESFYGFIIGPHCSRALATWGMQGVLDTKPSEPVSVFDQSLASNAASAVANLAV